MNPSLLSRAFLQLSILLIVVRVAVTAVEDASPIEPRRLLFFSKPFQSQKYTYSCVFPSLLFSRPDANDFRISRTVGIGVSRDFLARASNVLQHAKTFNNMHHSFKGRFGQNAQISVDVAQFTCRCMDADCLQTRMIYVDYPNDKCFGFQHLEGHPNGTFTERWMPCAEYLNFKDEKFDGIVESYLRSFEKDGVVPALKSQVVQPLVLPDESYSTAKRQLIYQVSYFDPRDDVNLDDNLIFQGTGLRDIYGLVIERSAISDPVEEEAVLLLDGEEGDYDSYQGRVEYFPANEISLDPPDNLTTSVHQDLGECFNGTEEVEFSPASRYTVKEEVGLSCTKANNQDRRFADIRSYELVDPIVRETVQETTTTAPRTATFTDIAILIGIEVVVASGEALRPVVVLQYLACYYLFHLLSILFRKFNEATAKLVEMAKSCRLFRRNVETREAEATNPNEAPRKPTQQATNVDRRGQRRNKFLHYLFAMWLPCLFMMLNAAVLSLLPVAFTIKNECDLDRFNLEAVDCVVHKIPDRDGEGSVVEIYAVQIIVTMTDTKLCGLFILGALGVLAVIISECKAVCELCDNSLHDDNQKADDGMVPGNSESVETWFAPLHRYMEKYREGFPDRRTMSEPVSVSAAGIPVSQGNVDA